MAEKFTFISDMSGNNQPPAIMEFPVAATQTLLFGDLVILSSGKVAIAGASTARVLGVMAQDAASLAEGTMVRVYVVQPWQVWKATADADATSLVLANRTVDINATTQTVDVGDTSNGCIQVIKLGSANTEVYIHFCLTDMATT